MELKIHRIVPPSARSASQLFKLGLNTKAHASVLIHIALGCGHHYRPYAQRLLNEPIQIIALGSVIKATGNIRAIQILLGHTKIENMVRYLGVDIEDALELAEHADI